MFQILINGLIVGSIYALISVGFNLIYSCVRFHHLAYAAVGLIGAYITHALQNLEINFFLSMPIAAIISGFIGVLIWKFIYSPLRKKGASDVSMIVASFGLLILLQNLLALIAGSSTKTLFITREIKRAKEIFGASITFNQIIILVVSIVTVIIFELILNKSKIGTAIRAVGQNRKLAEISGIQSKKVIIYTFYIATFLSTIGMSLVAIEISLKPTHSLNIVLKVIVACIIGGLGSVRGALAGGLILGIAENFGIFYFGTQWQDTVAYLLLVVFLLVKPKGLFSKKLRQ